MGKKQKEDASGAPSKAKASNKRWEERESYQSLPCWSEALKDDHDAFTVVIGSRASVLDGEDDGDANVKDITIENFSVSARGKELLKNAPEVIGDDKIKQLCKKFEIYDDESCREEWESGSAGKGQGSSKPIEVSFSYPNRDDFKLSNVDVGDLVPGEVRRSQKLRIGRHFVDLLTTDETPVQYILRLHPDQEGLSNTGGCAGEAWQIWTAQS
ncbi:ATP-BINDING TRANSPORT PROTEIN-RELATED [Salix purpurea]|uniref:ATP-BINDING TRANSPORT PROTEIN-RELATED n=1 Tax=Salix purpurea TaxID=77065 RepID=A0A9Q0UCM0_SALPP|nr:ATP-BINDING TRANSPORT PROTEIN-RELATED [Salix purpurea]